MRETQKTVYYCDHCSKHGLRRAAMEKHESVCTGNPSRVCRWRIDGHSDGTKVVEIAPLAAELSDRSVAYPLNGGAGAPTGTYLTKADVDWLRDEVKGCPACMLAALRQSGVFEWHHDHEQQPIFSYEAAVEELRAREREDDHRGW